jgi:hypothetical protein
MSDAAHRPPSPLVSMFLVLMLWYLPAAIPQVLESTASSAINDSAPSSLREEHHAQLRPSLHHAPAPPGMSAGQPGTDRRHIEQDCSVIGDRSSGSFSDRDGDRPQFHADTTV